MDPPATVSYLHMCADTVEINKCSGSDTQLTENRSTKRAQPFC